MTVGFLGLGIMGEPMAANLLNAGVHLRAWNRSRPALERTAGRGALACREAGEVFRNCPLVVLMLADAHATDEVLGRASDRFADNVRGRTLINMATVAPDYSCGLAAEVKAAGGDYIEAPVSGSRPSAERGELVGMLAGDPAAVERARPVVQHMCSQVFACGKIPNALMLELSVNLFLLTMVTGLVEAAHFASHLGLDPELFRSVLDAGPMASAVSRAKLDKLVQSDLRAQAVLRDALANAGLIATAARERSVATPLLDQARQLLSEADGQGLGSLDMIAVIGALEELTAAQRLRPLEGFCGVNVTATGVLGA